MSEGASGLGGDQDSIIAPPTGSGGGRDCRDKAKSQGIGGGRKREGENSREGGRTRRSEGRRDGRDE